MQQIIETAPTSASKAGNPNCAVANFKFALHGTIYLSPHYYESITKIFHFILTENSTCGKDRFKCNFSGTCIPQLWVCDGDKDCQHTGEDEDPAMCQTRTRTCGDDQFLCKDGGCVPEEWVCDHDGDCGDNSDESANCSKNQETCPTLE